MAMLRHASFLDDVGQALSIKYNNSVYEMQSLGVDVIVLSLGEAFFDLPIPTFESLPGSKINHYSHSRGLPNLREKLADYYKTNCGFQVDPDREIIITAGSKAAIFMSLLSVLEPGDEVIIPEPSWVSYPEQVRLCRGIPVMTPWYASVDDLQRYVTDRTRVVIINNPQNPSGRVLTADELRSLHALADRRGIFLLVDEAYNEFVSPSEKFVSCGVLDPDKEHTIICNSMSKNYGISGWRIGYVIASRGLSDQILKLNQHIVTCAPTILCYYLGENFDRLLDITRPQIEAVVELRNRIAKKLLSLGVECMPGSATFYLFASLGNCRLGSTEFADRLLYDSAVSVVPGIGYGASCDRFIRISIGTEPIERLLRGVTAISALIRRAC